MHLEYVSEFGPLDLTFFSFLFSFPLHTAVPMLATQDSITGRWKFLIRYKDGLEDQVRS